MFTVSPRLTTSLLTTFGHPQNIGRTFILYIIIESFSVVNNNIYFVPTRDERVNKNLVVPPLSFGIGPHYYRRSCFQIVGIQEIIIFSFLEPSVHGLQRIALAYQLSVTVTINLSPYVTTFPLSSGRPLSTSKALSLSHWNEAISKNWNVSNFAHKFIQE